MARGSRFEPGGFSDGELMPGEPQTLRPDKQPDERLSPRGQMIWRIVWVALAIAVVSLVAVVVASFD